MTSGLSNPPLFIRPTATDRCLFFPTHSSLLPLSLFSPTFITLWRPPSGDLSLSPGCQRLIPDVLTLGVCPPRDSASPFVSVSLSVSPVCWFSFTKLYEWCIRAFPPVCFVPLLSSFQVFHSGEEVGEAWLLFVWWQLEIAVGISRSLNVQSTIQQW